MLVLYLLMAAQMMAWAWFSYQGGVLSDKKFLIFTGMMMLGQIGAGIETWILGAWGAFVVQVYFFAFTAFGGIRRYQNSKKAS